VCYRSRPTRRTPRQSVDHQRPHLHPDHSIDLFDLIADLPLAQREVLVVCGWLGYDYSDAATLLEVPVGTVRSRLHRARSPLAGVLALADDPAGATGS
jgi:DNA-directed RNA polymerase specialized sigma24 family protein